MVDNLITRNFVSVSHLFYLPLTYSADHVASEFTLRGIPVQSIHGNRYTLFFYMNVTKYVVSQKYTSPAPLELCI